MEKSLGTAGSSKDEGEFLLPRGARWKVDHVKHHPEIGKRITLVPA